MHLSEKIPVPGIFRDLENRHGYEYSSPAGAYLLAGALLPWFSAAALICCATGLYLGLFVAPVDVQRGEVARIAFIHVPASWVAMLLYLAMAAAAGAGLALNSRLAAMAAQALAPTGLMLTFLSLWTGCLWSKPVWGSWWVWDLGTYSELILMSLYIGCIGLHTAIEDLHGANKTGAWLALAGVFSIPVNFAAAQSWTADHQVTWSGAGELASLAAMSMGFLMYGGAAALQRLRCVILEKERQSDWVSRHGGGTS